jgi:hypothetical protein
VYIHDVCRKNPTCVSFSLTRQRSLSIIFSRFTAYYSIDDIVLNGRDNNVTGKYKRGENILSVYNLVLRSLLI